MSTCSEFCSLRNSLCVGFLWIMLFIVISGVAAVACVEIGTGVMILIKSERILPTCNPTWDFQYDPYCGFMAFLLGLQQLLLLLGLGILIYFAVIGIQKLIKKCKNEYRSAQQRAEESLLIN